MNRIRYRALALVLLLVCLPSAGTWAASAEERLAHDYLEAAVRANADRMLGFYHPDEINGLRARVLKVLEDEAVAGGGEIRARAFGVVTSLEDVRRLIPGALFLKLAARVGLPSEPVEEIEVLGTVEENAQLTHVLARLIPPEKTGGYSHLSVVSLLRHGKGWKVALPTGFQMRVDKLLSEPAASDEAGQTLGQPPGQPTEQTSGQGSNDTPPPANTAQMERFLRTSIDLLRNGDCATYFGERMSPQFRANTSQTALQRLAAHCERSVDTRETYIAALEIAREASPKYEQDGARAVYDMSGKGLPFQRFVLEKIGDRWYVAE